MSKSKSKVFADFQNADSLGRLRLNCVGTIEDLAQQGVQLKAGQQLVFYQEELEAKGTVVYSAEEKIWVAVIDWNAIEGSHSAFTP